MIDPNSDSASKNDAARNIAGTPRWVKASGIIVLVLVLLFVILHLAGRGRHGGHTPPVHDVGAHQ